MSESLSKRQWWEDFPESLLRQRDSWLQAFEQYSEERIPFTPADCGVDWCLDRLRWFGPLADALKIHAVDSEALSCLNPGFDHFSLCLSPERETSSCYHVICEAVGQEKFEVHSSWRDHLIRSEADGTLEVVRAGSSLLFEGNAEVTGYFLVQLAESWKSVGPPMP